MKPSFQDKVLNRTEIIGRVRDKMERHPGLDWTCAAQSVAMEITWNEPELLETLKSEDFDLAEEFAERRPAYEG